MTGNSRRQKGRAIFLAAIMVISVIGMSVAFTGAAAATISTVDADAADVVKGSQGQSVGNLEVDASNAGSGGLGEVTLPDGVSFDENESDLTVVQQTGSVSNLQFEDSQTLSFDYSTDSQNDIQFVLREIVVDVATDYDSDDFTFDAEIGAQGPTSGASVNVLEPTLGGTSTDVVRGQQGIALNTLNINAEAGSDNLAQHAAGEELTISIPSGESRYTFNTSSDLTVQNASESGFVENTTTVTDTEIRITPQEELAAGATNSTYAIDGVTLDVTGESDGTVDPEFVSDLNLSTVPPNAAGTVEAVGSSLVNVEAAEANIDGDITLDPGVDGQTTASSVTVLDNTAGGNAIAEGTTITVEIPDNNGITFDTGQIPDANSSGAADLDTVEFPDDKTLTAEVSTADSSNGETFRIGDATTGGTQIGFDATNTATESDVNLSVTTSATSNAESVTDVTGDNNNFISIAYPIFQTNNNADLTIDNDNNGVNGAAGADPVLRVENNQPNEPWSDTVGEDTTVTVTIPSTADLTFDANSTIGTTNDINETDASDISATIVDDRTLTITWQPDNSSDNTLNTQSGDGINVTGLNFNTTGGADEEVTLSAAVNRTSVSISSENVIDVALMTPDQISEAGPNTNNQPGATVSQTFTVENASSPSAGTTEPFGGADVSFTLDDQPSGASATLLNNTLTTDSNGEVDVFLTLGDEEGSYNVTGSLDSNPNVNATTRFDVDQAGDPDSLEIFHVKNGFTEGTYSNVEENEAHAIVTIQDAAGTNVSSNIGDITALLSASGDAQIKEVYNDDFGENTEDANADGTYDFDTGTDGKLYVTYSDSTPETVNIDAIDQEGDVSDASTKQVSFFRAVQNVVLSTNTSSPVVGAPVEVTYTLTNANGQINVSGLNVNTGVNNTNIGTMAQSTVMTDGSGQATATFNPASQGTVKLNGISKSKLGSTTLTVDKPSLVVNSDVSSVTPNTDTDITSTVTFANNGSAVEGATLNITGAGVSVADQTTDADGNASYSVNATSAGTITVEATKANTNAGQDTITVGSLGDLDVSLSPDSVVANQSTDVTVSVTNASSSDGIEGASVAISGQDSNTTDANGETVLSVNPSNADDLTVDVSATGFNDAQATLTVTPDSVPPGAVYTDPNSIAAQFDSDGDGKISRSEVTDGVNAYFNGQITRSNATELVNAYFASQQ